MRQARHTLLLLDDTKLGCAGGHEIGPMAAVSKVLVDGASDHAITALEGTGAAVHLTADLRDPV
jgi:DeoR/GlpR family transcriptional regulator of sugar metabolism